MHGGCGLKKGQRKEREMEKTEYSSQIYDKI
jgi:hypothetical protein